MSYLLAHFLIVHDLAATLFQVELFQILCIFVDVTLYLHIDSEMRVLLLELIEFAEYRVQRQREILGFQEECALF